MSVRKHSSENLARASGMPTTNNADQDVGVVELESAAPLKGSTSSPLLKLSSMSTNIVLIDGVEWARTIAQLLTAK